MKRSFLLLFLVALIAPLSADPAKWTKDIEAFEKADAAQPPPKNAIFFIGSSSIRMWKTLKEDFPEHAVVNRGFGGSEVEDSVAYVERIVLAHSPRMIVIYAGGNDINAGKSPDRVVADYEAFVAKVRAKMPDIEIAYISIAGNPSRWAQIDKVREVNRRIADIAKAGKGLTFINVHDAMLGPDGMPLPDIFLADRLHMNEKGYAIWKKVVGPYLPKP